VLREAGRNPFLLDSHRPRMPLDSYTGRELRYRILARTDPDAAERLHRLAQQQVSQRWATYEEMAARSPEWFPASGDGGGPAATAEKEGNGG
jgi:pyruvate-ferredoxin/flavodoxin oxidoreductase